MGTSRWYGRRVAVTGGSALIGASVVEWLCERGARVRVASRSTDRGALVYLGDALEWRVGDVGDAAFCASLLAGCDELIHAASYRRNVAYHLAHRDEVFAANEAMTLALLSALKNRPMPATFFSTAMAGIAPDAPQSPDGYIASKARCEERWNAAAARLGFPLLRIRPVSAYGPGDAFSADGNVIPALIVRCAEAQDELVVWGSGEQTRSFVYAPDAASALIRLLEANATGAQYVSSPESVTIRELATLIRDLVRPGRPIRFDAARPEGPSFPADLPVHPALRNFSWTTLRQGLAKTVEGYRLRRSSPRMQRKKNPTYAGTPKMK